LTDFRTQLEAFDDFLKTTTFGLKQKFDNATFKMLVNCLKSEDPESVRIAILQLAKEKNPLAIAPLYVVAKAHPSSFLRDRALEALKILDPDGEAMKIADGKDYKVAVADLVKHFGNYKGK
jgi:HEAT repeat protein